MSRKKFTTVEAAERLMNSMETRSLDFEIRCDDFNIAFYPSGQPSEYRSSLTILENGVPVIQKDIIVNDPLRHKGINIFQSSYGELPPEETFPEDLTGKDIVLEFTNRESGMTYPRKVAFGEQIQIPEGKGAFLLKEYKKSNNFSGQDIGPGLIGVWMPPGGNPEEILLPVRFRNFDKMRGAEFFISISSETLGTSARSEPVYYTGLQVTRDPGVWVVYAGFLLMIIGCIVTFFMSHQQLCIEVERDQEGFNVAISGTANKNRPGLQRKLDILADSIGGNRPESSGENTIQGS